MATEPVRAHAFASALDLSIRFRDPVDGDVFTYISSEPNAALAIAAAYESADEQTITNLLDDVTVSPMFAAVKACYRSDLRNVVNGQLPDAEDREELALDILICRAYLAGALQHLLPKAVR